jgi:hypothetical protein
MGPADPPRCGNCTFFSAARPDDATGEIVGECRFGTWPPRRPATSWCRDHLPVGALATNQGQAAAHAALARAASRRASTLSGNPPRVAHAAREPRAHRGGEGAAPAAPPRREPIEIEVDDMDEATFRNVLREILAEELGLADTPIGERWRGGEIVLRPGREGTQERRVPLDRFFHKIVMIRDKLRVLEQKINGHSGLSAGEKLSMQQYITACYGSLTTFNVLFADEDDRFVGQAEKD